MSIRLVLRFSDSHNVYPGNTPYDLKVHIQKPLYFQGHWTVSLLEFSLLSGNTERELYVCSNLRQDSIVGERERERITSLTTCGFIKGWEQYIH